MGCEWDMPTQHEGFFSLFAELPGLAAPLYFACCNDAAGSPLRFKPLLSPDLAGGPCQQATGSPSPPSLPQACHEHVPRLSLTFWLPKQTASYT